jgi:hypothetical protein
VLELYGDTLSQTKRFAEAAEQYKKLLEFKMTDLESFPIWEKLASCYMRDQKWSEAVPVLLTMLQKSRTEAQREQAVVWLAQSYIESDQGHKVIEFCRHVDQGAQARLDIDFNWRSSTAATGCLPRIRTFSRFFSDLVLPPARLLEANQKLETDHDREKPVDQSGQPSSWLMSIAVFRNCETSAPLGRDAGLFEDLLMRSPEHVAPKVLRGVLDLLEDLSRVPEWEVGRRLVLRGVRFGGAAGRTQSEAGLR